MDENEEKQEQRALLALGGIERIRRVMFEGQEYWSVVDVVGYLTEAANPSKYWNTLRGRLVSEGARAFYERNGFQVVGVGRNARNGQPNVKYSWRPGP